MLDLAAARRAIHRDIGACLDTLAALNADRWSMPTQLPGWTVGDLTRHLVWGQTLQAGAWERLRRRDIEVFQPPEIETTRPSALVAELHAAHRSLMDALEAADETSLDSPCAMPYGTLPARFVLQVATMEAGTHRFDLEQAVAIPSGLAADTVQAAVTTLSNVLPMLAATGEAPSEPVNAHIRGEIFIADLSWSNGQWQPTEVDAPHVTFTGNDEGLVLFALGRRDAAGAGVTISGADDPATFKRWFPGP